MTNILCAIYNLATNPIVKIGFHYKNSIRIQQVGDALEFYIKDMFANTIYIDDKLGKERKYSQHFSYLGGANNPPDLILKGGDAIEVKKIEGLGSSIALNSSYPKKKLYSDDSFITSACRACEDWQEKDIIYAIGSVSKDTLVSLWMVYGDCYCADKEVYERVRNTISSGVNGIPGVEFCKTKELARVNKVDPLGITYLRVRGMWGIDHPSQLFGYLLDRPEDNLLNVIMLASKYESFSQEDKNNIESTSNINIADFEIKNPNNPAQFIAAKHISIKRD